MDYLNLSKEVSYALRHAPWEYELELDSEGWVSVEQLISSFRNGKIRAFYGHSIPMKISKEIGYPPKYLYHGTSINYLDDIKLNGLKPMSRQYVHLSEDVETATLVGNRKKGETILLKIDTELAQSKGIKFYIGNEKVWLSDYISPEFIKDN